MGNETHGDEADLLVNAALDELGASPIEPPDEYAVGAISPAAARGLGRPYRRVRTVPPCRPRCAATWRNPTLSEPLQPFRQPTRRRNFPHPRPRDGARWSHTRTQTCLFLLTDRVTKFAHAPHENQRPARRRAKGACERMPNRAAALPTAAHAQRPWRRHTMAVCFHECVIDFDRVMPRGSASPPSRPGPARPATWPRTRVPGPAPAA